MESKLIENIKLSDSFKYLHYKFGQSSHPSLTTSSKETFKVLSQCLIKTDF